MAVFKNVVCSSLPARALLRVLLQVSLLLVGVGLQSYDVKSGLLRDDKG